MSDSTAPLSAAAGRAGDEPDRRRSNKHRAILDAASTLFLRQGYLGTSMDEIATLAAVSKQTVYKHFGDKQQLFSEIVISTVDDASDPTHAEVLNLNDSGDIDADLRDLARRLLARVIQPRMLALRRLVIGEVSRFPELGQTFYDRGPGRTIDALGTVFARLAERGVLKLDDPALAAAHFNWLIVSIPLNRAMLLGDDAPPSTAELNRYADTGVSAFLSAYGRV